MIKCIKVLYVSILIIVTYCDIIYHIAPTINPPPQLPTFNSLMEKLERVQYQAALAVTGIWQGSNFSKLNEELGWETLSDRRLVRLILQIHKIMNNETPSYLKDKVPPHLSCLMYFVK